MKKTLFIILFFVLSYNGTLVYVNGNIFKKDRTDVYNDCSKVWSSRGLYTTYKEQNTITSIQKALDNGFKGVEVDFYYDIKSNSFIVSHNKPQKDSEGILHYVMKNGKLLTLEELFLSTSKEHYFWLDYKNLDRLSDEETKSAIEHLDDITKEGDLRERLYIEGSTPNTLEKYTNAGYKTLFAFQPLKADSIFSSISSNIYKIAYYFYNITAIAMPYGSVNNPKYSVQTQENLKGIPTFLFHVPDDEELLEKLISYEDVRVMLIGRDKSVNRAYITNCSKEK